MLRFLNISNLAVIDKVQLEFDDGLNVLTGETGSGKSIIVDALNLLFGGRGSAELIRSGESKLFIEGAFDVTVARSALTSILEDAGVDVEQELILRREITSNGKTRFFVCGQMITAALLRQIRPFLVDIYGQGEQHALLEQSNYLVLLDNFGNLGETTQKVRSAYEAWYALDQQYRELSQTESERIRQRDVWQFEAEEIAKAKPVAGEDAQLERERSVLANAEKVNELAGFAYGALYEHEGSVSTLLGSIKRKLDELASIDESVAGLSGQVDTCRFSLEDVAYTLRDYLNKVEVSPDRQRIVEERLVELERLKRKYGGTLEKVIAHLDETQTKLDAFENNEALRERTKSELDLASRNYFKIASELSRLRKDAAKSLEKKLIAELKPLAMENVRFSVKFDETDSEIKLRASGIDSIDFLFSPNPGEDLRPLMKIASGGELSRLMLAIKSIMAPLDFPRTMVFDEVDSGISGRVSQRVGEQLRALADHNQVLCVTHQAQIARFADVHYRVEKRVTNERTSVTVKRLDHKDRETELATLLGGVKITEATRLHAAELLSSIPRRRRLAK